MWRCVRGEDGFAAAAGGDDRRCASWLVRCTGDGEGKRPLYDEKTSFVRYSFRNRPGRAVKQIDIDQIRRGREEKIWVGDERPKPRDDSSTVPCGKGAERGIEARESGV